MRNKNIEPEQTLEEMLEEIAHECKASGRNNLAIVIYSYLGSKKAGLDSLFAAHCQDFARSGIETIKDFNARENN